MSDDIRNAVIEECAVKCEQLGDAEFERLAKKGVGIAHLAIRHYMNCAEAIRAIKTAQSESEAG